MLHYLLYVLVITLWIFAFVDCLSTPEPLVRGLPKVLWTLIILLFGVVLIGPLAWLAMGKRRGPAIGGSTPSQWHREHRTDGRRAVGGPFAEQPGPDWVPPDDNPEFLRSLDELNKHQRKDGTSSPEGE